MFNDLDIKKESLPSTIPVFPLSGALLLPGIELPLNIFEPRYVKMVDDALSEKKIVGIIQPQQSIIAKMSLGKPLYKYGCAGKIRAFNETDDGRYLIVLSGISRFEIEDEIPTIRGYRRFQVKWNNFADDFNIKTDWRNYRSDISRRELFEKIDIYLKKNNYQGSLAGLNGFGNVDEGFVIDFLASYLPFTPEEKQLFLEAKTIEDRAASMYKVLGIAEAEANFGGGSKTLH